MTAGCYDDEGSLKKVGSSNGSVLLNDCFWPIPAGHDRLFHTQRKSVNLDQGS